MNCNVCIIVRNHPPPGVTNLHIGALPSSKSCTQIQSTFWALKTYRIQAHSRPHCKPVSANRPAKGRGPTQVFAWWDLVWRTHCHSHCQPLLVKQNSTRCNRQHRSCDRAQSRSQVSMDAGYATCGGPELSKCPLLRDVGKQDLQVLQVFDSVPDATDAEILIGERCQVPYHTLPCWGKSTPVTVRRVSVNEPHPPTGQGTVNPY